MNRLKIGRAIILLLLVTMCGYLWWLADPNFLFDLFVILIGLLGVPVLLAVMAVFPSIIFRVLFGRWPPSPNLYQEYKAWASQLLHLGDGHA